MSLRIIGRELVRLGAAGEGHALPSHSKNSETFRIFHSQQSN